MINQVYSDYNTVRDNNDNEVILLNRHAVMVLPYFEENSSVLFVLSPVTIGVKGVMEECITLPVVVKDYSEDRNDVDSVKRFENSEFFDESSKNNADLVAKISYVGELKSAFAMYGTVPCYALRIDPSVALNKADKYRVIDPAKDEESLDVYAKSAISEFINLKQ